MPDAERLDATDEPALRRELGTISLTIYGVGVIVGAGIYVLVGEIAAGVGGAAWIAFVGAAIAALPTALAYAELASRHPDSAGAAFFASRAFGREPVAFLVGFLIVASGLVSVATVAHGFARYLAEIVGELGEWHLPAIALFVAVLSATDARGIREATWLNIACTVLAVAGLLAIAIAGAPYWAGAAPTLTTLPAFGPALGTIALAFYAFLGFEDICTVADETKNPSSSIPRAILLSLAIATALYVLVAITALAVVGPSQLAASPAPLALVSAQLFPSLWPGWIALIAVFAVTNTALFNLIMTSRVIYGMARRGLLPAALARVDRKRRTPHRAIALAFALAVVLALTGVIGVLARATNVVILLAFMAVNLSLLVVRLRGVPPDVPSARVFRVPLLVPVLGIATTGLLLSQLPLAAYARGGAVVGIGVALHLLARWRRGRSTRA